MQATKTGKEKPACLGDVLYGDAATTQRPEADWTALVRAIAGGDQLALQSLYVRTHHIVFTLTFRISQSRETAEELTLDVFHDVWRRASAYDRASGPVIAWILNLARSRAIDRLRYEQRKKRVNPYPEKASPAVAQGPDAEQSYQERTRVLRNALARLTPDERSVIENAFFSGLTYAEVADRLGLPLGTVKTRIRRGLTKLRDAVGASIDEP